VTSPNGATRVAPTRRGVHDKLAGLAPGRAPEFNARHTLRLRVEFARQLRRRRTQLVFGILLLLPIIIALAFKLGGGAGNDAPGLVSLATSGGSNFALFTEFAAVGFLLVVVVALFCGDTVASEAQWASLRYLLAQPVPRSRLLRQKLIVAGVLSIAANVVLPLWAYAIGSMFFGGGAARSPLGTSFGTGETFGRLAIIVAYVCGQLVVIATLSFLLSVSIDNPLGAVGGAVLLNVISAIIDQITALGTFRHYLPTHWNYAWTDVLSKPVNWSDMTRGTGLCLTYGAIFLAFAWLRFDRKDITS
jgi:ABC-2 type transport system permease protein